MSNLGDIKRRIVGVKKTQQITRALKMVSAVKLRRAQQRIVQARPYAHRLREILGHIAHRIDCDTHPLLDVRDPGRVCYVIVTSDQGLCGSFNHNIIRRAEDEIVSHTDSEVEIVLIGKKSRDYFSRKGYKVIGEYVDFFKELTFKQAVDIAELLKDLYVKEKLDRIYIVYNEFKTAAQQDVIVEQLLPIIPVRPHEEKNLPEYIFEPDQISILDRMCPNNMHIQMWRALLESYASEMGARLTAMEYATENADKLINELTMQYNRIRQENITNEILEIVAGSEALKA
ncbi:MAG: ATP synthase F1 subunit gamma [candidate division KSB1 bacterium]|jgi:F-type H+-transporting ATPase subunit gamma|nr:ATP synthase F1 subunit gamma [candidate division KSB1 bacterium]